MTKASLIADVFHSYVAVPRWVAWRAINGCKVPFVAGTTRKADASDPATWQPGARLNSAAANSAASCSTATAWEVLTSTVAATLPPAP
jgi:hypothetical protein